MKKYIVLTLILLVFLIFFTGCSKKEDKMSELDKIKERGYIIVGVKGDSPPFGFYDQNGILKGIDVEIAQRIANDIFQNDLPSNIKFVIVTAQNKIAKLNKKEVDILVATMSINQKRKLIMDFSNPYFVTSQKIMVPTTSKITGLNSFNTDGTLAVIMGTTGEKNLHYFAPNARIVSVKTYIEAYNLLLSGQVSGILGDDCILSGLNRSKNYKIINHAYSREYYGVAVRKSKRTKELLNSINASIMSILDEKKINLLKKQYILVVTD